LVINKQQRAKALVLGLRRQMPRLGTRKLHYLLKDELAIGRDKLFQLLRVEGLLICKRRRYTVTNNSKQIMGYELFGNMEAASTLKALQMAIANRKYNDRALVHHSDRGLQYCSKLYTD
jgi:putative transposase